MIYRALVVLVLVYFFLSQHFAFAVNDDERLCRPTLQDAFQTTDTYFDDDAESLYETRLSDHKPDWIPVEDWQIENVEVVIPEMRTLSDQDLTQAEVDDIVMRSVTRVRPQTRPDIRVPSGLRKQSEFEIELEIEGIDE